MTMTVGLRRDTRILALGTMSDQPIACSMSTHHATVEGHNSGVEDDEGAG
jgi:hypothetical protein